MNKNINIEVEIFRQPSGDIRGMCSAQAVFNGKMKPVAAGTIFVDGSVEIGMKTKFSRMSLDDAVTVSETLRLLAERVKESS